VNDQQIETEIQAKGLTAPRVTPQDIEDNIEAAFFFTEKDAVIRIPDMYSQSQVDAIEHIELLTFCVLLLKNGLTVTGEPACASPENFDAELGRKIARQNAVNKIWPLMGYAMKQRLHETAEG